MKRSTFGWVEILLGILMIGLGIYTLLNPVESIYAFVIVYAIVAIISGIADFVFFYQMEKRGGFGSTMMLISGILNVLVGILLLTNISAGTLTLTLLFPVWFIFRCIARLSNLDYVKAFGSSLEYWVALIANILGIILGIMLLFNPLLSATTMVYFVGFYLLVAGLSSIIVGFGRVGASRR